LLGKPGKRINVSKPFFVLLAGDAKLSERYDHESFLVDLVSTSIAESILSGFNALQGCFNGFQVLFFPPPQ
jgi:hypothetical protein